MIIQRENKTFHDPIPVTILNWKTGETRDVLLLASTLTSLLITESLTSSTSTLLDTFDYSIIEEIVSEFVGPYQDIFRTVKRDKRYYGLWKCNDEDDWKWVMDEEGYVLSWSSNQAVIDYILEEGKRDDSRYYQ